MEDPKTCDLQQAGDKTNTQAELQQNYRKPRTRRVHPAPAGADFSIFFGCTSILPRPHLLPRLWSLPTGCPLSTLHCYTAQNLGFTASQACSAGLPRRDITRRCYVKFKIKKITRVLGHIRFKPFSY